MSKLIDTCPGWATTGGIFTAMQTAHPDIEWLTEGARLDVEYYGNHSGDKTTAPLLDKFAEQNDTPVLTQTQMFALAGIIWGRYSTQWEKLYDTLLADFNPMENYDMTETTTPNTTKTRTPNLSRNSSTATDITVSGSASSNADVYGFNSEDGVPQADASSSNSQHTTGSMDGNKTYESETGTETETETGTITHIRHGNIGVLSGQDLIRQSVDLWGGWCFIEKVYQDVDKVLTIPLYDIPIKL